MLYMFTMILRIGEMAPVNDIEYLVLVLILIPSAIINTLIFGDIVSVILEIEDEVRIQ